MAEARLRPVASLRGTPAVPLSAWRGRSSRRYVVGVHDMAEPDLTEMGDAVVIAVRRDGAGIAQPVCVATSGESPRERLKRGWLAHVARRGATEMHVHRLAQTEDERRAVLEDLDIPAATLN